MDINTLNNLWIEAGHNAEDLYEQMNNALNDDNFAPEAFADLKTKYKNAKAKRDALKDQLAEAQAIAAIETPKAPLNDEELEIKDQFINDFKDLIRGNFKNLVGSNETDAPGNGGLTIPKDIQTTIHTLVRQYDSLQQYVNVEAVTTLSGSRVYEKWTDVTPLKPLETSAAIGDNDDPQLTTVKYLIKRYAGITTITNSLLKDTAENIIAWLSSWIAKKVVVTRNTEIIKAIDKLPTKPTLAKWDDIIDLEAKVDPAIKQTSMFLTNTSGFTALKKVKNAMGDYLMERDVKSPTGYSIDGFPVKEVADRWLPNKSTAHPLYFGDLKQAVTLFDRENMSLLATNIGAGAFEYDLTKIRVIDGFDVATVDNEAFVPASFTAIADQTANFQAAAAAAKE